MTFVLDSSVTPAWVFEDEGAEAGGDPAPDSLLTRLVREDARVPALWPLEVANALLVGERRGRLSRADSQRFVQLLAALPIEVDAETPGRSFRDVLPLAREQGLSTYDAAYLELALRIGVPLATRDAALVRAAGALGVPVV
ncbi:MAG: type II toxin-antitoxin system VapC family toxin [Thermoleophilia bacterium]